MKNRIAKITKHRFTSDILGSSTSGPRTAPKLKPKFGINIRHEREMGIARITRLKGIRRYGAYLYCTSEALDRGEIAYINTWLAKNDTSARARNRSRELAAA